jgi:predicted polyphosphate/ATP-dependent NAD kinase
MFKLGLIINPIAGVGGPMALKGSDGDQLLGKALETGAEVRANNRALTALQVLSDSHLPITVYGFAGDMAEFVAVKAGLGFECVGHCEQTRSTADDTVKAAQILKEAAVDLLVFVGGDGTARDIHRAVGDNFPVLGIPSGVKMHSGVYAVSPTAAGELIKQLIDGGLVDIGLAEVRDIDEVAFRAGQVKTRFYGELLVPAQGHFLQHVKSSGREVEALVLQDIAADIVEGMRDNCIYIIGPGTTTRAIMEELGLENTLLGVDAVQAGELIGQDLSEQALLDLLSRHQGESEIIVTAIGGQGHILGRGNQQISPAVLRKVGLSHITVVATKTKIAELQGRPLLVDSNDPELDKQLAGYCRVVTGYHDAVLYCVA